MWAALATTTLLPSLPGFPAVDEKVRDFLYEFASVPFTVRRLTNAFLATLRREMTPCGSWRRLTVLGALGAEGVVAAMSIEAATSTAVFLAFLDQVLIPALVRTKPGAVVVMDNPSAHRAGAVRARLERAGLRLLYLPRYAPELSPIEPCWSKVKERLRARRHGPSRP